MADTRIGDVSDTALWVAHYRAEENQRPDALFRDPFAARLAGDRGRAIAAGMQGGRITAWMVVVRTYVIDAWIRDRIAQGVDTVLNLGAGMDSRPYRMDLPPSLRWIEVDHPQIIDLKESRLAEAKPNCRLERVRLDLAQREARQKLFSEINAQSAQVLVLTEGVIPYLTPDQVAALADDLRAQRQFRYWIVEYLAPESYHYIRKARGMSQQMQNAPFQFFPPDWLGFFDVHGWKVQESRYLGEVGEKLGRSFPLPWWANALRGMMSAEKRAAAKRYTGYLLLAPGAGSASRAGISAS